MKTSSACSLLTVLALLGGLPCALGQGGAEEPGAVTADKLRSCPYFNRSVCELVDPAPDKCQNDSQCPGSQRCCCVHCRQECAETVKRTPEKPGFCPVDLELEKRCRYVL
ncbi:hypothetical protein NDU88_011535 [Pleurodeles waltl]|uniref:WAP domain-containing protein n=1 Tax=Pleurodeles waltl TaxID=8319 RepID=A0AAV7S2J6_PLEWA|nr:hypothetical protein NDU88_011535 [Pleurodeles waltl]